MKKLTRKSLVVALSCVMLVALVWFQPYQGLYVHMQDSSWTEVTISSDNMREPLTLKAGRWRSTAKVSGISHGVYDIHVKYEDGREFFGTLFHLDAGIRQRLDVYIERVRGTEKIRVRQYANKFDFLFKGEKKASETSKKEPFQLDWI